MIVEVSVLQNVAPNRLNRDDLGRPKTSLFGGTARARVSSQSWKAAMRSEFGEQWGVRTKRIALAAAQVLVARGKDPEEAAQACGSALRSLGFGVDAEGLSEYNLFVRADAPEFLAGVVEENWAGLVLADPKAKKAKPKKGEELIAGLSGLLESSKSVDIALFGRMIADATDFGVDGACRVAHSIGTHDAPIEFDFYTAVDDLSDTSGAAMMGTTPFISACLYRHASVDLEQLLKNLGGDVKLAEYGANAFIRSWITSLPAAGQGGFEASNPPSLVLAVARGNGAWNLSNAFANPIKPSAEGGLVGGSANAMANYFERMYAGLGGASSISLVSAFSIDPSCDPAAAKLNGITGTSSSTLDGLCETIGGAVAGAFA